MLMAKERQSGTGKPVEVAYANDRIEAEMIQGLLESGGVQSALQALGVEGLQLGFGTLPRSPQRVMVDSSQAEKARALLAETLIEDEQDTLPESVNADFLEDSGGREPRSYGLVGGYARIYLWSFGIMALAFGVFLLLRGG
jgi:hypothetical protein